MKELFYSVLRYAPSLVSGEKINLAVAFHYPDTDYREFFSVSKWSRVSAFDDSLSIPVLKDIMLDIQDEIGTPLTNPNFDIKYFCAQYHSELYFDKCIKLADIPTEELSSQIEEVKKMYFQFEFEKSDRPTYETQKKFLRRILKSEKISYQMNVQMTGSYNEKIVYDYLLGDFGIQFFNLNAKKIDGNVLNKAKAWAWNCENSAKGLKMIIIYDLADETHDNVKPLLEILKSAAYRVINIHNGFDDILSILDYKIS